MVYVSQINFFFPPYGGRMMNVCELVESIKVDKEKFYLILEQFKPLLKRYARLLYRDDREDMYSELTVALWEAICRISYCENDGQVINYLSMALKNKFLELYRSSCKYHNHMVEIEDSEILMISVPGSFCEEIIIQEEMQRVSSELNGKKRKIFEMIFVQGYSNTEVADKLKISRQYVHRIKKELCDLVKKEIFL